MELFNKISKNFKIKSQFELEPTDLLNSIEYKIIVLGDKGVGKTSLCTRFTLNEFNLEVKPSTMSECYSKSVKIIDQKIKLFILDVEDHSISTDSANIFADINGAIIVYDVTKAKTYESIEARVTDLKINTNSNFPIMIVGNKNDLNFLRNDDKEEIEEKVLKLNCVLAETSCVNSLSVKNAFKLLISKIYYSGLPEEKKNFFLESFRNNNFKDDGMIKNEDNSNNNTHTNNNTNGIN